MANLHSRSNSLPSQSHPIIQSVEDHLRRLKSSEGASTSALSVCENLASLRDVHEGINNLIQMSSFQQAISNEQGQCWINELLEGSLRLVDLCGSSRDIVYSVKESVQELESSIRRNKVETATAVDANAYAASRKRINKMVSKCLKNLKNSTEIQGNDYDLKSIGTILRETESLNLSVLKSVLELLSGENERSGQKSWPFLSKFTQKIRVHSETEQDLCILNIIKAQKTMDSTAVKNTLKHSQTKIQEVEEGLESLFRSLVKTRVSLLNLLSH